MGTRADFYIGRGESAEWLGSIAMDGYPSGNPQEFGIPSATTEAEYRASLKRLADDCEHWTSPEHGWPWPWKDSRTTDYAYAFDGDAVWASCFGGKWYLAADPAIDDDESTAKVAVFPNMESRQRVALGKRSGLIVLGGA